MSAQHPRSTNEEIPSRVKDGSKTATRRIEESSTNYNDDSGSKGLALTLGNGLASFSDVINDNLIAARYGTFATITLLTAFGLSRTPVFFRYKRVSDIPSTHFSRRRTIYGRIVHIVENDIISTYCVLDRSNCCSPWYARQYIYLSRETNKDIDTFL